MGAEWQIAAAVMVLDWRVGMETNPAPPPKTGSTVMINEKLHTLSWELSA